MAIKKNLLHFFAMLSFVALTACGGGGDEGSGGGNPPTGGNPPPTEIPPTSEKASRFLQQTTFGPTTEEIQKVVQMGFSDWIDQQMTLPVTRHLPYYQNFLIAEDNSWSQFVNAWWHRSVKAPDQLRQRVAFALSQLLVISQEGVDSSGLKGVGSISNYYDLLLENSFGNYRDLLENVTLSPVMGEYLSMLRNRKPDPSKNRRPDENYAREIMQLFTIGLVELELNGQPSLDAQGSTIPTYNQEDIVGLAHVFTGWTWGNAPDFWWWDETRDLLGPMKAFPDFHDEAEKKIVGNNIIPAGQTPEQDLEQALDVLFNHPNVAPFVSKQLIQRLVTSNPSPAYVQRVASVFNNNGNGIRGDLAAVVKAILLDDEAIDGVETTGVTFGKVKEPLIRLTSLWRAFDAYALNGQYDFRSVTNNFDQGPLQSPTVFNFYSPFYVPQGALSDAGLVAPELQLHTEGTMSKMTNHLHWRSISMNDLERDNPDTDDILLHLGRERALAEISDQALIDHLDLLMLAGNMSSHLKQTLTTYLATIAADRPDRKAFEAIGLIVTSPEYAVQR